MKTFTKFAHAAVLLIPLLLMPPASGEVPQWVLTHPVAEIYFTPWWNTGDSIGESVAMHGDTVVLGGPGWPEVLVCQRNARDPDDWHFAETLGIYTPIPGFPTIGIDTRFGHSVAIHEPFIVVGAPDYEEGPTDENSGIAVVYRHINATEWGGEASWEPMAALRPTTPIAGGRFGSAVACSGHRIAVGAPQGAGGGAVYIFERTVVDSTDTWVQVKRIDNPGGDFEQFGHAISLAHNRLLVGAPDSSETALAAGAAFLYERNTDGANQWGMVQQISSGTEAMGDKFGWSVALSADTAVVGSPEDNNIGTALVFERNAGGSADHWGMVKQLTVPSGAFGEKFGKSVSIWNDQIVVGAPLTKLGTTAYGAAYLFLRNNGGVDAWGHASTMFAPDRQAGDQYGHAVATWNGQIAIGAPMGDNGAPDTGSAYMRRIRNNGHRLMATPDNPSPTNAPFARSLALWDDTMLACSGELASGGHAYILTRNTGGKDNWGVKHELVPSTGGFGDFGHACALSGDLAVVAAPLATAPRGRGRIHLFERNSGAADAWGEIATLVIPTGTTSPHFGNAIDCDDDFVVVTIAADAGDRGIYVFERNTGGAGAWGFSAFQAMPPADFPNLGVPGPVAIEGETIVLGKPGYSESFGNAGAVSVFLRNKGGTNNWGWDAEIWPDAPWTDARFGSAVDISGSLYSGANIAVGAPGFDEGSSSTGAVYIFRRHQDDPPAAPYGQAKKILPPEANTSHFGSDLKLTGSTLAVAAITKPGAHETRVVYIFERNEGGADNWGMTDKLLGGRSTGTSSSIAMHGRTVGMSVPEANDDEGGINIFRRQTLPVTLALFTGFRSVEMSYRSGVMDLSWFALKGVYYTIEYSDNLHANNWKTLPGWSRVPGEEQTKSAADQQFTQGKPAMFYRVRGETDPLPPLQNQQ